MRQFVKMTDELRRFEATLSASFERMDGILERWSRSLDRYFRD